MFEQVPNEGRMGSFLPGEDVFQRRPPLMLKEELVDIINLGENPSLRVQVAVVSSRRLVNDHTKLALRSIRLQNIISIQSPDANGLRLVFSERRRRRKECSGYRIFGPI